MGMATILALVLTAGLAYGAGRVVGTRGTVNQAGRQGSQRTVAVVPGSSWGTSMHGQFQGGTAYRDQMRRWMRDRLHSWLDHAAFSGNGWANRARVHASTGGTSAESNSRGNGSSYRGNGCQNHSGYHHDHHMGSGSWSGGSGSHHGDCCGWR